MNPELLIVKKAKHKQAVKVIVVDKVKNFHVPNKYENILENRDPERFANVLYDLNAMGYPVEKGYELFTTIKKSPRPWMFQ